MRFRKELRLSIALLLVLAFSVTVFAQPAAFDQKVVNRIDVDRMMTHIKYLSEDLGPRVSSSPEEKAAAEYIAKTFAKYGYDPVIQEFPRTTRAAYLTALEPDIGPIYLRAGSKITEPEGIVAKIVDCGYGGEEEFPEEVAGNIAIVRRTPSGFSARNVHNRAVAAGAIGILFENYDWRIFSASISNAQIPFATLNNEAGALLRATEGITGNFAVREYYTSYNVIATRKPNNKNRDTGNIVVLSAHIDSVPTAPGANDNASGVAGLLEISRILSSFPIETEVRFLACGSEEVGLLGSAHYVGQLSEDEKDRIIANYNMDMIGTSGEDQTTLYVNVVDGEDNLVSSTARAAAERLGYSEFIRAPFKRGSSDHVPFYNAGITAANFIYRDPDNAALEPWYHQPYDTIEKNIDVERLRMATEIVAAAAYDVLRPDTPNLYRSRTRRTEGIMPVPQSELNEDPQMIFDF